MNGVRMYGVFVLLCVVGLSSCSDDGSCHLKTVDGSGATVEYDLSILSKDQSKGGLKDNYLAEETNGTRQEYFYWINVCAPLKGAAGSSTTKNASILQHEVGNVNKSYTIGITEGTELKTLRDGDLRMQTGKYRDHDNVLRYGTIVFFCHDGGLGSPAFLQEDYGTRGGLEYTFVWNTCAACPVGSKERNSCPASSSATGALTPKSFGMSFIIIACIAAGLYLLIGVAYKRFVLGAKGTEQIPNVDFWCGLCGRGGSKTTAYSIQENTPETRADADVESDRDDDEILDV